MRGLHLGERLRIYYLDRLNGPKAPSESSFNSKQKNDLAKSNSNRISSTLIRGQRRAQSVSILPVNNAPRDSMEIPCENSKPTNNNTGNTNERSSTSRSDSYESTSSQSVKENNKHDPSTHTENGNATTTRF